MYQYSAYGLNFHSEIVLPELVESKGSSDVIIKILSEQCQSYLQSERAITYHKVSASEIALSIAKIGVFQIIKGKEVWITPPREPDWRLIQLCVSGSIMGMVLHQRGYHILHAGAVNIVGKAVVFIGESGRGKSSMTASLLARGHQLVADDIVPLNLRARHITTVPGYPQIKIGLEVAKILNLPPESLVSLHSRHNKYAYRLESDFSSECLSVGSIYVLDEGDKIEIERLSLRESIVELIRHSYGSHVLHQAAPPKFYLTKSLELYKRVPIYRLRRPKSLLLLPELAKLIESKSIKN